MDVFLWNYEDMPRLDLKIAHHRLNIKQDVKPVKQQQQKFKPEKRQANEVEVKKLKDCGFIHEEQLTVSQYCPRKMGKSEFVLIIEI